MEIVGRTTIHPLVFHSGKLSGYLTWVLLGLDYLGVRAVAEQAAGQAAQQVGTDASPAVDSLRGA